MRFRQGLRLKEQRCAQANANASTTTQASTNRNRRSKRVNESRTLRGAQGKEEIEEGGRRSYVYSSLLLFKARRHGLRMGCDGGE